MSKRIVLFIIFVLAFSLSLSTNALAIANKDVYFGGKAKEGALQKATITVSGTLTELPKTSLPVSITISSGGKTYLADITSKTKIVRKYDGSSKLTEFALGDNVEVSGTIAPSGNIQAKKLKNNSISLTSIKGIYGDIKSINKKANSFILRWAGENYDINVDSATKFIIPGIKSKAKLADLKVGDRLQGRAIYNNRTNEYLADIIIVVRRSSVSLIKNAAKTVNKEGEILKINSTTAPTTIEVTTGSTVYTVNITGKTILVRKNFGKSSLSEFIVGDKVHIVGVKANSTTINAKMVKNNTLTSLNDYKVDDDQDGIPDTRDAKLNDHDNDGVKDSKDADDDNDGIPDASDSSPYDFDNDGINDASDTDNDNDGTPNASDAKPYDHDNDDIDDTVDTDDDEDGIEDSVDELPLDHDNDGIRDAADSDDDNDGIADVSDAKPYDHDNDSSNDAADTDDDEDGVIDTSDAKPYDHDNDGINDASDTDDDNDGIADISDVKPYDYDNDGVNDGIDTDDDNDDIDDIDDAYPYNPYQW